MYHCLNNLDYTLNMDDTDSETEIQKKECRMTKKLRYQIVESILSDIVTKILEISNTNSWKEKHHPYTTTTYNLCHQLRSLGKITSIRATPDGNFIFIGLSTGLLAFDSSTQEIVCQCQKREIKCIEVISTMDCSVILLTINDIGEADLNLYQNKTFTIIEEFNSFVIGSENTSVTDCKLNKNKTALLLKCRKENIEYVDIRYLPQDKWLSAIQSIDGVFNFPTTTLLCSIHEPTPDVVFPHLDASNVLAENILQDYKKCYYPKSPNFTLFKLWKLNSESKENVGVAVWWSGETNLYLYTVSLISVKTDSIIKPFVTWHHSDMITHCTVSGDSKFIAVALHNGVITIKELRTGLFKRSVRLCSFGKIVGIWFAREMRDIEITSDSTNTSSKSLSVSGRTVTSSNQDDKTRTHSSAENVSHTSTTNSVVNIASTDLNSLADEAEEGSEEYTPTPTSNEEKNLQVQLLEKMLKTITCDSSDENIVENDPLHVEVLVESKAEKTAAATISSNSTASVDKSTASVCSSVDVVLNSCSHLTEESKTKSSNEIEGSYVDRLIKKFQSGFIKMPRGQNVGDSFSLMIGLTDGSLWQFSSNDHMDLKAVIPTANETSSILTVQQVYCEPNFILCLTSQGKIYLVDIMTDVLVKEVHLPISHNVLNPSNSTFNVSSNGKTVFVAAALNVNKRYKKHISGDVIAIDLFPQLSLERADKVASVTKTFRKISRTSEFSNNSLVVFRPSFPHDTKSDMVLKEIHEKFKQTKQL